jgi:hypothetical protein
VVFQIHDTMQASIKQTTTAAATALIITEVLQALRGRMVFLTRAMMQASTAPVITVRATSQGLNRQPGQD